MHSTALSARGTRPTQCPRRTRRRPLLAWDEAGLVGPRWKPAWPGGQDSGPSVGNEPASGPAWPATAVSQSRAIGSWSKAASERGRESTRLGETKGPAACSCPHGLRNWAQVQSPGPKSARVSVVWAHMAQPLNSRASLAESVSASTVNEFEAPTKSRRNESCFSDASAPLSRRAPALFLDSLWLFEPSLGLAPP